MHVCICNRSGLLLKGANNDGMFNCLIYLKLVHRFIAPWPFGHVPKFLGLLIGVYVISVKGYIIELHAPEELSSQWHWVSHNRE